MIQHVLYRLPVPQSKCRCDNQTLCTHEHRVFMVMGNRKIENKKLKERVCFECYKNRVDEICEKARL